MSRLVRELPLFQLVILLLLAVLALGTVRRMTSHVAQGAVPGARAARELAESQGQLLLHTAEGDADVGPGSDEAMLARHPGP